MSDDDALRELHDLRAMARERGLSLVMLRHEEDGEVMLETLYLGTQRQEGGMTALRILDRDDLRHVYPFSVEAQGTRA